MSLDRFLHAASQLVPSPNNLCYVAPVMSFTLLERRTARRSTLLAVLLTPVLFVVWDLYVALTRAPAWSPGAIDLVVFSSVGWSIGATLALLFGVVRAEVIYRLPKWRSGAPFAGALDGLLIAGLVVVGHGPAALEGTWRRLGAFLILAVVGAVAAQMLYEKRRHWAGSGALLLSVTGLFFLLPHGDVFVRLMLHGVIFVATAHLLQCVSFRTWPLLLGAGLALGIAGFATTLLTRSAAANGLLAQRSIHVKTWAIITARLFDSDGDDATNLLGERDCDPARGEVFPGAAELPHNGVDDNCSRGDGASSAEPVGTSVARGSAVGRDILILSADSFRADLVSELVRTREVLGPHARLLRAVSPTPTTITSLSSTMRGRLFREVSFSTSSDLRGRNPIFDSSPTIADILRAHGYDAVTVPTHRYLSSKTKVLAGFDSIVADSSARFVPAAEVAKMLLPRIANASRPTLAYVHYMETHHPFRYGDQVGPDSLEGLTAAVRYVDESMASLITAVKEARGALPIVVIFGDHGEEFGEHGGRLHASTAYAEQVRVGFFLAAPGVPDGDFNAPVSTAAIPATLLDLLGMPAPDSMTVTSLLPYLTADGPAPQVAVSEARSLRMMNGYTFEHYRLITDPVRSTVMLFDSRKDPFDQRDIAASQPELVRSLLGQAREWDERY